MTDAEMVAELEERLAQSLTRHTLAAQRTHQLEKDCEAAQREESARFTEAYGFHSALTVLAGPRDFNYWKPERTERAMGADDTTDIMRALRSALDRAHSRLGGFFR